MPSQRYQVMQDNNGILCQLYFDNVMHEIPPLPPIILKGPEYCGHTVRIMVMIKGEIKPVMNSTYKGLDQISVHMAPCPPAKCRLLM